MSRKGERGRVLLRHASLDGVSHAVDHAASAFDHLNQIFLPDGVDLFVRRFAETLAYWWAFLNSYEWPKELADPPPSPRGFQQQDRGTTIMHECAERVGDKETMRAWNVRHRKAMTNDEFETWWEKRSGR